MRQSFMAVLILFCAIQTRAADPDWAPAMRKVHARFTGQAGTFAQFGDSITVTMAYWSGLKWQHKNLDAAGQQAYARVSKYMRDECWAGWKGPDFGSQGSMTIRWADQNIDRWLKRLNPETALIMFGTNDIGQVSLDEYEKRLRHVVQKCLDNGTVVILSTIPPRSGHLDDCRRYAAVVKKIASEMDLPVIDFLQQCLQRRPDDWDGSKFKDIKDPYQVPTLIGGDGVHPSNPKQWDADYSDDGLRHSGYGLRSYLTLMAYSEVIQAVFAPK